MHNIAIFYHIHQINHWANLFERQIIALQQSGLYDSANYIHFGINGNQELPYDLIKVNSVKRNINTKLEADTLSDLHKFAESNKNYKILYIHTKTVTHTKESDCWENVNLWLDYLEYFNIFKWNDCVGLLDEYDCVGTEWSDAAIFGNEVKDFPHYCGNFWWATANYITKLDPNYLYGDDGQNRWRGEFWIGTGKPKFYNFYNTGIKFLYYERIPNNYKKI